MWGDIASLQNEAQVSGLRYHLDCKKEQTRELAQLEFWLCSRFLCETQNHQVKVTVDPDSHSYLTHSRAQTPKLTFESAKYHEKMVVFKPYLSESPFMEFKLLMQYGCKSTTRHNSIRNGRPLGQVCNEVSTTGHDRYKLLY